MVGVGASGQGCVVNPHPTVTAGASAQARFETRSANHDAKVRRRRPHILLLAATSVGAGLALTSFGSAAWTLFGLAVAGAAVLGAITALVVRPDHVRAWAVGADGERRTAEVLSRLESDGYRVLHDRRIPGSRANIDHIVVGPTGVYVVETKSWSGAVRVRNGVIRVAGRRSAVIDQVRWEADAVAVTVPGTQVTPIVCVHRADLPLRRLEVDGVRVVGPKALLARLREGPVRLDLADVERLTAQLDARLPRAA